MNRAVRNQAVRLAGVFFLTLSSRVAIGAEAASNTTFREIVLQAKPVVYWNCDETDGKRLASSISQTGDPLVGAVSGNVQLGQIGPRPPRYPLFQPENRAAAFDGARGLIRVADPGNDSTLDFDLGDSITMEAWVNLQILTDGQQVYIVGKGRTQNAGVAAENQNYALRLRGIDGTARVSFLFRNRANRAGNQNDFHRWNSTIGFVPGSGWHHLAVSYTFGEPKSIVAYVDGKPTGGQWDLGGPTDQGPVVDNDELWIGSSMGGNPNSTFHGLIDEVAIYRRILAAEEIAKRFRRDDSVPIAGTIDPKNVPGDAVLVRINEGISAANPWVAPNPASQSYTQTAFAWVGLPKKYSADGLRADRTNPFLVRAYSKVDLPPGEYDLLLRSRNKARLLIDGRAAVAQNKPTPKNASGHEAVPDLVAPIRAGLRPLPGGYQEVVATVEFKPGQHLLQLEAMVGGKGIRAELGELCVAIARKGEPFDVLVANGQSPIALSDESWEQFAASARRHLQNTDQLWRREATGKTAEYWNKRHEFARREILAKPAMAIPDVPDSMRVNNDIDRFIGAKLADVGVTPAPLTDDFAFIRRVTLDTIGVLPTRDEIDDFLRDKSPDRRKRVIDRLLGDPRWADNWMGYWQDVLAENPNILKPKLNNTGPFRWWIYESLLDNKPMDRFVTELVSMNGSRHDGGPAGFAMATQNDVPMAAKAYIVAKAFLAMEMKCARCHDAPFHDFKQQQLFSLAAMLERKPIDVPKSSSVAADKLSRDALIEVSLKPGSKVEAIWPFENVGGELPNELLQNKTDPRHQLAAAITSPHNTRFAQVMVNRLWRRYLGYGIVEPVDDWQDVKPSHPDLLDWLAREFVASGYDMKHVARLIVSSYTYQRQVLVPNDGEGRANPSLFASPQRRRMTAEQLVDSMFTAVGKEFHAEVLTLDPDGRRPIDTFINLGAPQRAWHLTSLSNERDRPALALPVAQSLVDLLEAYGWRQSRQDPITVRKSAMTSLQPLTLANGLVGRRIVTLSDDSAITELCLQELSLSQLIDAVYLQLLSRRPTPQEETVFSELLSKDFEDRRVQGAKPAGFTRGWQRHAVSWSNHLHPKASEVMLQLERDVDRGDPPTARLESDWRERMEDVVWALINSPEFVFVP
jgi:hypothetical protein